MDKNKNQNTMIKAGIGFAIFAVVFVSLCSINPVMTVGIFWLLLILISTVY